MKRFPVIPYVSLSGREDHFTRTLQEFPIDGKVKRYPYFFRQSKLIKGDTIMEHVQDPIKMIREKDTFALKLGIEIEEAQEGHSLVSMPLGEGTANALGNVQGGAIFSLADMAIAAAANSEGVISVTIEANIHYMSPCRSEGKLYATARKIHETRRLGYFHVEVFQKKGEPVAVIQSMVYRKI